MAKTLPPKIYIRWNMDTNDEPWLECSEDPSLMGEFGNGSIVGEYALKRKVRVVHKTEVKELKTK